MESFLPPACADCILSKVADLPDGIDLPDRLSRDNPESTRCPLSCEAGSIVFMATYCFCRDRLSLKSLEPFAAKDRSIILFGK